MAALGYPRTDLLVETEWLQHQLNNPGIRIVDCDQIDSYRRAHIKNAVGIRVHHYIKEPGYDGDPKGKPLVAPPETVAEDTFAARMVVSPPVTWTSSMAPVEPVRLR